MGFKINPFTGKQDAVNDDVSTAWGDITGTLSDQTDLQTALDAKLESGDNVSELVNDAGYIGSSGLADYVPYAIPDNTNRVLFQYRPATLNAINGTGTIVVLLDNVSTTSNKYFSGVIRGHNYVDRSEFEIRFGALWYSASYAVATPAVLSVEGSAYFGSVRFAYDPSNRPCLLIGTTSYVWHSDSRVTLDQLNADYFSLTDYEYIRDNAPVQTITRITSETGYTIKETKPVAAVDNYTNTTLVKVWGDATPWDYRFTKITPKNIHLGSNTTGTVAIKLPAFVNTVYNIVEIKGFDYTSTTGGWRVTVSGLNTGTSWVNPSVNVEGKPPFTTVRLAFVGADSCILLGTTTTAWTRMVLSIDFHHSIGASTDPIYTNATGYTITTAITSEASYSIKATYDCAFNAQRFYSGLGTEALPSLAPYGDTNTGRWYPAADTIAESTGGTERTRITSTGNFGIANSNPFAKCTVTGTTTATCRLGFAYSNSFGQSYIDAGFSSVSQNSNTMDFYINQMGGTGTRFLSVRGDLLAIFQGRLSTLSDLEVEGALNHDGSTVGLYNVTPVPRATTAIAPEAFVANTSGIVDDTATFGGYSLGQIVKALKDIGILT